MFALANKQCNNHAIEGSAGIYARHGVEALNCLPVPLWDDPAHSCATRHNGASLIPSILTLNG